MKDYVGIGLISRVMMLLPAGGKQVDFNVADDGPIVFKLYDRLTEVGAGLVIPETGVEHLDLAAVGGLQAMLEHALIKPNALEQ